MASVAKTVVATGLSNGIGLDVARQLLTHPSKTFRLISGVRDVQRTKTAYDGFGYDASRSSATLLPLDLTNLKRVKAFAQQTLEKLGGDKIDYFLMNAGINRATKEKGTHGSKYAEAYLTNHYSQHYLMHLLRDKLVESKSRIIFVSSGAVRMVKDPDEIEAIIQDGSDREMNTVYAASKFTQLLGAHYWRRQLADSNLVVAVSPGMIKGTNLAGPNGFPAEFNNHPDAKDIPTGARSVLEAFWREDIPEDPEQIFLTSWGEWWSKDVYEKSLDKGLQDKWCPSVEEQEKEHGLTG